MSDFIPKTSFQSLHTELYEKHIKQLNKWLDEKLTTLFSTPAIRVLSAHLNNPSEFQSITLYADGHDNQINYNSIFEIDRFKRTDLFSYKLKESGYRTQAMMDINGMWLSFSQTEKYAIGNDGTMLLQWKPKQKMAKTDVL